MLYNIDNIKHNIYLDENDSFYYKQVDNTHYIKCTEKWLQDNINDIYESYKAKKESFELIDIITSNIGNYTSGNMFNYIWIIPNFCTITIELYNNDIILKKDKGKNVKLSKQKILTFIDNNNTKIKQCIENQRKIKEKEREKEQKEQKEKEQKQEQKQEQEKESTLLMSECRVNMDEYDSTKKVGSRSKNTCFYIKRSLKECYETQACKKYPTKFPWEM